MHTLLAVLLLFAAAKGGKMNDAIDAYRAGKFAKAADLFEAVIKNLREGDHGGPIEREAREKLVLSLYAAKKTDAASVQYGTLVSVFPDFRFDPDRVSPETIEFFTKLDKPKQSTPEPPATIDPPPPQEKPVEVVIAKPDPVQPRIVTTPASEPIAVEKRWRWYYLMPLGIGQFLAGSPVRGAIFAVLQVGLITLNAVAYALLMREIRSDGTVESVARAYPLQIMTNVGFFGWIGALTAGTIDGAFGEP